MMRKYSSAVASSPRAAALVNQHLAVADDRHESIAEIVDHAAGHFAESAEPLLLHSLSLRGLQVRQRIFELSRAFAHAVFQQSILLLDLEPEKTSLKQIPDAHADFRWIERLHQQIGGAGGERAAFVFGGRITGQNEHGNLFVPPIGPQSIEHVKATQFRHGEIEENEIRRESLDRLKSARRIVDALGDASSRCD